MALGARCATLALAAALLCGSEPGAGSSPTAADPIPCEAVTNQTDCGDRCKPLPAGSRKPRKFEVTGYHTCGYDGANGSEWRQYDWSKLTVVAEFCGRQDASFWGLLCAAHTHGVQVINWMDETSNINQCPGAVTPTTTTPTTHPTAPPHLPGTTTAQGFTVNGTNQTKIQEWINGTVNVTMALGYDGLLFDIEGGGGCGLKGRADNYTLTNVLVDCADAMHQANPAAVVAYSSPTWLSTWGDRRCDPKYGGHCEPNYQPGPRLNTTHSVDWLRVSKHFDMLQPMEYCSLDNGTAPCAPLYWVNGSLETYKGAGIPKGKAMPIFPWVRP